jgi:hypothetical protein
MDEYAAETRPPVRLVGINGNAYSVLAACRKAAQKAGWDQDAIKAFFTEATSDDYNHLLATAMEYFDVS